MDHVALLPLYRAWLAPDAAARAAAIADLAVPGPIALRSRYRHLRDPQAPAGPLQEGLSLAEWRTVLELETEGDRALREGDLDAARDTFIRLAGHETTADHRVVRVHALIGEGDVARAFDKVDEAITAYETALTIATSDRYRFGQLRALVPLGYLSLAYSSAVTAGAQFRRAEALAVELADPLYRGNVGLGLAECLERSGNLDEAVELTTAAYQAFDEVGSTIGRANAAHRTGALLHRARRRSEAVPWLRKAHAWFVEVGDPVGLTNVLSGIGDLHLDVQEFDTAEQWYEKGLRQAERAKLPRARAHALQDVARVARGRHRWADAVVKFDRALAAYRDIDDIGGIWHALDKKAEAQAELGRLDAAARTRLEAVHSIEAFRAGHRDERSQREYRERFRLAYSRALAAVTAAGDATAFAVVADCLAGRRLAGLIEAGTRTTSGPELEILQNLLAHADQRLARHRPEQAPGHTGNREERIRLLGAFGIRHGLAEPAEASLDDQLAAVYLPPGRDGAPLLAAVSPRAHLVQLLVDPVEAHRVHWLWRAPGAEPRVGCLDLDDAARDVLTTLGGDRATRVQLHVADLAPVVSVLPPGLVDALLADADPELLIVPIGELWMIPWSALPLPNGAVLGELVRYAVCPSLTVQRLLVARAASAPTPADGNAVDVWRSPLVSGEHLTRLDASRLTPRWLASASAARQRLRDGGRMMVVVGHGRRAPGMGHYLELDEARWLVPADLLGASTPRRLALLVCEAGSIDEGRPSDPICLATLALAARSDEVLATVGELGDSHPAARYAESVLANMAEFPLPEALRRATRWLLSHPEVRTEPIFHWAPLIPVGTV
ncbi:tetratricopeptide repeat protein [Micromonospora echinofusca]|uniref:tetratricopeptide repeat protein n=1 Tax=Micromonospora echinofusca TaxID=47858 RepID=UPI0034380909